MQRAQLFLKHLIRSTGFCARMLIFLVLALSRPAPHPGCPFALCSCRRNVNDEQIADCVERTLKTVKDFKA